MSGIVRAVHQSSSKLGDTPLARLDLFESLPSRGFAVEPLQQTLQQNRALHRSTTQAHRPAADVELYSSTALQSALHLYSSTVLYTLHPLHPPSGPASPSRFAPLVTHRAHRATYPDVGSLMPCDVRTHVRSFEPCGMRGSADAFRGNAREKERMPDSALARPGFFTGSA